MALAHPNVPPPPPPKIEIDLAIDHLFTAEEVCEKLSISRRTLDSKKKEGLFPEPTCYVFSSPRWSIRELNEWLNKVQTKLSEAQKIFGNAPTQGGLG